MLCEGMASSRPNSADVVLVGGGLANGLIALRLRMITPNRAINDLS
jgi:hypothetical protein